jgi:uncharacterized SAM-binding protein YcdF (DUF218 family)
MSAARRLTLIAALVLLAAGLGYAWSFAFVVGAGTDDQRQGADAIIVLGAAQYDGRPSPVLEARLNHALTLFQQGWAPIVVLTGGVGTGDTISEAMVGKRYLEQLDVPDAALVVRPEGRSTGTSMEAVQRWLEREDLASVILVSDPFHMGRLRLEARRLGMIAYTSPTRTSPISGSWSGELSYYAAEALKVPVTWARTW